MHQTSQKNTIKISVKNFTVPDDYVAIGEAAEDTEEASDDADAADEATAETAEDDVTEEAAE